MTNRKRRVLIVEDEIRIGQLICKLIHWEELGLECQQLVEDGEKAYEVIRADRPDIVITDIRMPKINGLDLIEMVAKQYPGVRFIVLSGYKEFEYAHRALQYEVDGYLLKPINEEELNEVLGKIARSLQESEQETMEKQKLLRDANASRQIIKRDFLRTIIEQEDGDLGEEGQVVLTGDLFRGIDIKLDCMDPEQTNRRQDKAIAERVIAIVEEMLSANTEEILSCEKDAMHIFCLFNYNVSRSKEIRSCINDMLLEIKKYLMRFDQYEVTIGVGSERHIFGQIRFSILEASRAVGNRIRLGTGRLIYFDMLGDLNTYVSPVKGRMEELFSYMETYSEENLIASVDHIFEDYLKGERVDYVGCYEIARELINLFFDYMAGENNELEKSRRQIWNRCQNCTKVSDLKNYLEQELRRFLTMRREAAESESTRPVRLAKAYVDEHYAEKIVLEDLAEIVGLNPVYFSVLFKKETDMNFSAYLIQVRMEKAREMLCNTNETIAVIGERVGYKDSRHFSQTFTKVVGLKPALYRRLHA